MTGRYNYRTGVVDTYLGRSIMTSTEVTMAEYLRKASYRTGIFGKWHLGDNYPYRSIDQGFEESIVCKGGGVGQPSDPAGNGYFNPNLQRNGKEQRYDGYCTDIFFNEAMSWMDKVRRERFFCYIATNAPHDPLTVSEDLWRPYRDAGLDESTARVYGMVSNIDTNTGKLLSFLKDRKLDRDTLLIFLTDNGPIGKPRFNAGMRGQKGTVYQGGIRVPCFWRWPGTLEAGQKVNRIAAHIDVLPTVLDICGVKPDGPKMDGLSLMPLIGKDREEELWPDRTLFTQWHRGDAPELFRQCAARNQRYKLVNGKELYDLSVDPGETKDISAERPQMAERMRQQTERWFRDVSATRGYDPVRIPLGTPHENPVILTRQDWRGPRATWTPEGAGFWEVDVVRAGDYSVTFRMPALAADAEAELKIAGVVKRQKAAKGTGSIRFDQVKLPQGQARLEALLWSGADSRGAHYVDVEGKV
jgi:arylsulfatase A-like enzyme